MRADRIFETVLYADDLEQAKAFYGDILGMQLIRESELFLTFRISYSVLLIFDAEKSAASGRSVPAHGMTGEGHIAFAATDDEIDQWQAHLEAKGIEIEQMVTWSEGGRSLYIRDPAGNSVEFAPSTLWDGDWGF
jgi:catechol 2,3-dioxygenase-like lactoylglutathione lyase family enzyme